MKDCARRDLEQVLLRSHEPVAGGHSAAWVEAQLLLEPLPQRSHLHVVRDRHGIPAEPCRPAAVALRQPRFDCLLGRVRVVAPDEDLEARPPAMVGRTLAVEAKDFGPPAEQRGGVR